MTPKYWLKILAGMLGIFILGMVILGGIRRGSNEVRRAVNTAVNTAEPLNVPLLGMAFRTGKGELGTLQRMRIERSAPDVIAGFHIEATLNDGVDVDQFDLCEVTVSDPQHLDSNSVFDCLTAADSGYDALVNFGSITFQPSGERHRLMLPAEVRDAIVMAFEQDSMAADINP